MIYDYGKTIFTGTTLEVYRFENAPRVATNKRKRRAAPIDDGPRSPGPRRYDSVRRLRRDFIRLVQTNLSSKGPATFVTLTFATNATLDEGLECFREFYKRAKKEFGNDLSHISVPEFQKRGAIHFHCLIWGLDEKYVKQERSKRYIQSIWARGYVDIIPTDGSPKLSGYMAKYMQKSLQDERLYGRRAYYYSRNVVSPVLYKTALVASYAKEILGVDIELLTERSYGTEWLGRGNYQVYKVIDQHA